MKQLETYINEKLKINSNSGSRSLDSIEGIFDVHSNSEYIDVITDIVEYLKDTEYDLTEYLFNSEDTPFFTRNTLYLLIIKDKLIISKYDILDSVYIEFGTLSRKVLVSSIRINASKYKVDRPTIEGDCYLFRLPEELEYMYYDQRNKKL